MLYNAEDFNLNAHEDIQDNFSIDSDFLDHSYRTKIKDLKNEMDARIDLESSHHDKSKRRKYTLGGGVIGTGIGYAIGRKLASKTPIESQQRKRKIMSTVAGAALGTGIGYAIGDHIRDKEIKKNVSKLKSDYSRKAWGYTEAYKRAKESLNPVRKLLPTITSEKSNPQTSEQVNKWNTKYGKIFKS